MLISLTKYLAYAKKSSPDLTKEAEEKILDYYLQMRNVESEEMITVTPRQLEWYYQTCHSQSKITHER